MTDMWNTPVRPWLAEAEMTDELRDEIRQAMIDYENDAEAQAELERRVAPYRTKVHWRTMMKVVA